MSIVLVSRAKCQKYVKNSFTTLKIKNLWHMIVIEKHHMNIISNKTVLRKQTWAQLTTGNPLEFSLGFVLIYLH